MLEDLTDAFACHGFTWKSGSLEYMALGTDGDAATLIIKHREVTYTYQKVTQMTVLGVLLDSKGSTDVSVDHRLAIADNCARSSMQVLKGPGGITAKLRAWSTAPAATAAFGFSTWHITKDLLRRAQRLEYHWLRKVFSCRRKSDEGFMQYNVRTARLIEAWFSVTGVPPLFLRVIRTFYRAAWRENHVMVGCCDKPLAWIREARSAHCWTTCCALGRSARHRSGIVQQSSGHRVMWEDVLVEFLGLDWRQTRSTCTTYSDWRAGEASFVQRVCSE